MMKKNLEILKKKDKVHYDKMLLVFYKNANHPFHFCGVDVKPDALSFLQKKIITFKNLWVS